MLPSVISLYAYYNLIIQIDRNKIHDITPLSPLEIRGGEHTPNTFPQLHSEFKAIGAEPSDVELENLLKGKYPVTLPMGVSNPGL